MIGGAAEANIINANFDHKKSPALFKVKIGHGETKAGIENYSVGIGASASIADAELPYIHLIGSAMNHLKSGLELNMIPILG